MYVTFAITLFLIGLQSLFDWKPQVSIIITEIIMILIIIIVIIIAINFFLL